MTELSVLLEPIESDLELLLPESVCSGILSQESIDDLPNSMQVLLKYLLEDKGGEGSGHHGHTGLPGVWGGSRPTGVSPRVKYRSAKPDSFITALDTHLQKKYKPFVTPYTADEYTEMGARCFCSPSGKSGYALKPDGDIISVFSAEGSGEGFAGMLDAIARGGTKLDCFDGWLAQEFYPRFGFVEYDRWPWDDQYKPKDWDYEEFNRPDVILMRLGGKE